MQLPFRDDSRELQAPELRSAEPAIKQVTSAVHVSNEETHHHAWHREVVAVPEQELRDLRQRQAEYTDEVVGESLRREKRTHARVGADGGSAVPRPDVSVAGAPAHSHARQIEVESRERGCGIAHIELEGAERTDAHLRGVVEHPVDHRDRLPRTGIQEPKERPVVPGRHGSPDTSPAMVPDTVVERARPAVTVVPAPPDVESFGQRDQQLGLMR